MKQVWKQWREGIEVSNKGRVRNAKNKHHYCPERNNAGYMMVHLTIDGRSRLVTVHRMVAECFLENPNGYTEIDHIDRDQTNNRADNLRWCSRADNLGNMGKLTRKQVKAYRGMVYVATFPTIAAATRWAGVTGQGVRACCNGWQQTCKGYTFKYEDGKPEQLFLF